MKCLLLTAGFGNRLRPLTVRRAKPTLPVAGRPLILHTLDRLAEAGVKEVFMNLHHRPETVREVVELDLPSGLEVTFSEEKKILGTGGALKVLKGLLGRESEFLLVNGDCFYGFALGPIIESHRRRSGLATMALRIIPRDGRYAKVEVDDEGRVIRIAGMPRQSTAESVCSRMFVGVHVISSGIWDFLPDREVFDINQDVYPSAMERGETVWAHEVQGVWHDIGTPRRYLGANFDVMDESEGPAPEFDRVRIESPVRVGSDVAVGADSVLSGVSLGDHVRVGESCHLSRCVVMSGVRIGDGCTLEEVVIGDGVVLPDGSVLSRSVVVPFEGEEAKLRRRELEGDNVIARFDDERR